MGTLTAKARDKLKPSQFAGPNDTYPDENRAHAIDAKARAEQQYEVGNLTAKQKATIDANADKALAKMKGK